MTYVHLFLIRVKSYFFFFFLSNSSILGKKETAVQAETPSCGPSGTGRREHTHTHIHNGIIQPTALQPLRFPIDWRYQGDTSGIARSARSPRGAQRYYSHAADWSRSGFTLRHGQTQAGSRNFDFTTGRSEPRWTILYTRLHLYPAPLFPLHPTPVIREFTLLLRSSCSLRHRRLYRSFPLLGRTNRQLFAYLFTEQQDLWSIEWHNFPWT